MKKKDVLVSMHLLLLFFCIYHTFHGEKLWGCAYLAVMVFAVFFLGKRFRIRGGFLIVGAFMEAGMVLAFHNHRAELAIFSIAVVVTVVSYTLDWAKEHTPIFLEITPMWLLFPLLCHIPLYFTGYSSGPLQFFGVLYFLLYLLSMAVDNMDEFQRLHSRMEYLPLVQLGKVHFFSVLCVLLWVLFGMIIGKNERIAAYIRGIIQSFLSNLGGEQIAITPQDVSSPMNQMEVSFGESTWDAMKAAEQVESGSPAVGYVVSFLLLLLCLVLVLFVLYGLYCYLKRDKRDPEDEIEFISAQKEDEYQFLELEIPRKYKKRSYSANEMIRRKYKKKIKTALQQKIPRWASPAELEALAGWQQSEREKELHNLYEKARYSKEGCQMEEINRYNNSDDKNHG
ncbi:MAG: hypothetical protein K2M46_01870 [Lachnospiraceae bacterium]|nr:hypothetical protein [Lachnospiraceae bacterium]